MQLSALLLCYENDTDVYIYIPIGLYMHISLRKLSGAGGKSNITRQAMPTDSVVNGKSQSDIYDVMSDVYGQKSKYNTTPVYCSVPLGNSFGRSEHN